MGTADANNTPGLTLCVPKTSSTSCDQVIFVDQATDARLSSDAVLTEIDRLGERLQRRGAAQRGARAAVDFGGCLISAGSPPGRICAHDWRRPHVERGA